MERYLRYIVNAVHCLKWSMTWASYNRKQKVKLKAKLIDATLARNGSSSPPCPKVRKKMDRDFEGTVTIRNQLLRLYNQVRSFFLCGICLPVIPQISLAQLYCWTQYGFRLTRVVLRGRAHFHLCWMIFLIVTKE